MYCYCDLGGKDLGIIRVGGLGLGNMLFPWARAIVAAKRYNLIPIWPTWSQIKLGPYIRNEKDKRMYVDYFQRSDEYIGGIEKIKLIAALKKQGINENQFNSDKVNNSSIVVFSGMKELFENISSDHILVKNELLDIVNEKYTTYKNENFNNTISVHIRLGDFAKYDSTKVSQVTNNMRVPIKWYIKILNQIRVNDNIKVFIFSDGKDSELRSILSLPNVQRKSYGSSIEDLLALSSSNILIASNSTFSMWAAYLGRMPIVKPASESIVNLYPSNSGLELSLRLDQELPNSFLQTVVQKKLIF